MPRFIDLTQSLDPHTPPWPGNPALEVQVRDAIPASRKPGIPGKPGKAGFANVTAFSLCNHTGTHMDAPTHFYNDLPTIEQVPLSQCIGPCALITLTRLKPRQEITVGDLRPRQSTLARTRKVVLNTGWAARWGQPDYFSDYPCLSETAALWLLEQGVELVGLDTPSVDYVPNKTHFALLGARAVIVENLTRLEAIGAEEFELIVTPLPLTGLEASPVRAVARVEQSTQPIP